MLKWFKDKFNKNKEEQIDELHERQIEPEEIKEQLKEEVDSIKKEVKEVEKDVQRIDNKLERIEERKEEIEKEEKAEEVEQPIEEIVEESIDEKVIDEEPIARVAEELTSKDEIIEDVEDEKPTKKGFFDKLISGLTKTRKEMSDKIDGILSMYKKIDEELFEDLEEVLVTADVGVNTTMELIDRLRDRVKNEKVTDPNDVKELLKDEIKLLMSESIEDNSLTVNPSPAVMLVVGVNGVGKTTTIGKLANRFKNEGKRVLIAAGDTFRAAAIEQLEEWGNRSGVEIIAHSEGADPAAVIYDGIHAAKARKADILICDTAGRLHNKSNLMNELNKIFRIVEREYGDATKEVLLVLDATTGQNAINQAKVFKDVANITGVALTKLDGTAKGGVVIALQAELGLPIKLIGVGEGINDLQPFVAEDFVEAIFN